MIHWLRQILCSHEWVYTSWGGPDDFHRDCIKCNLRQILRERGVLTKLGRRLAR